MSTRTNPFYGSGQFGAKAMQKLNQVARRVEMFGVNSTSPVMATPHGTTMLIRRRNYREASFPWELFRFGYSALTATAVKISSGSVIKMGYTPVLIPGATLTLSSGVFNYVGLYVHRDMSGGVFFTGSSEADFVTDSNYVKVWFYIFKAGDLVSIGHLGNFDITAYGD